MRHTSETYSCPQEGEEMTGKDPNEVLLTDRAFRDDVEGAFSTPC
jgi:hypothetical protein